MQKSKLKVIIFDFDGVIHDTKEDLWKLHQQFFPKDDYTTWAKECFEKNSLNYGIEKFGKEKLKEYFELWTKAHQDLSIEKEIESHLLELKELYLLFIVSSNSEYNLEIYFRNNNLSELFIKTYGKETHKSKVEKFKILLKEYNLSKKECVFVTDTLGDILEANEVGIRTIAVTFGFHDKKLLEQGNPFKIVSSFEELRTLIDLLN